MTVRVRDLVPSAGERTLVMGVVNVTPDSFSDGGRWFDPDVAVAHGLELLAQGADLVDVGGESTRPGAPRVEAEEERRRVLPVVRALAAEGAVVSVDTTRSAVAEAALDAGARLVNDVSGGLADERMASFVAASGAAYVVMHWRGHSASMDDLAVYDDVTAEVRTELHRRVDELVAAGASTDQLVLDPGLGFSKTGEHNWQLLARLDELTRDGLPLLVGASRKRFLGTVLADGSGQPAPPLSRDDATAATSALLAAAGVWCVRVHAVPATVDAVRVGATWRAGGRR